ncbi:hypothetical protein DFJ74DRAFT_685044 [Hyaloraphidium curvatum]|nr:hypothetical protein DFJ74DRAFT_685044 [Hyaloraphidium curvatum]
MAPPRPAPPPPGASLGYKIAVLSSATALAAAAIYLGQRASVASPAPMLHLAQTRSSSRSPPPRDLISALRAKGFVPVETGGGGDCLFRALSHQLHRTPTRHLEVRQKVADEIEGDRKRYEDDVAVIMSEGIERSRTRSGSRSPGGDEFADYVSLLRRPGFLGDAVAIAAASRAYRCPFRVFVRDPGREDGVGSILFENHEAGPGAGAEKRIAWLQFAEGLGAEGLNHYMSVDGPEEAARAKL